MTETIPVDKALWERCEKLMRDISVSKQFYSFTAEARAIVAQLPTPVDPLVLRAREICSGRHAGSEWAARIYRGEGDDDPMMQAVLVALREKEAG